MWLTSYNCHTFDRDNFRAQFDCGARRLYSVIDEVTKSNFQLMYWPYIQDNNLQCMQDFIVESNRNMMPIFAYPKFTIYTIYYYLFAVSFFGFVFY